MVTNFLLRTILFILYENIFRGVRLKEEQGRTGSGISIKGLNKQVKRKGRRGGNTECSTMVGVGKDNEVNKDQDNMGNKDHGTELGMAQTAVHCLLEALEGKTETEQLLEGGDIGGRSKE